MSKFKVGDGVRFVGDYTNSYYSNAFSPSRDVFGTVIDVSLNSPIIVFDKNVGGRGIEGNKQHCLPEDLELVTDENSRKFVTAVNQAIKESLDKIEKSLQEIDMSDHNGRGISGVAQMVKEQQEKETEQFTHVQAHSEALKRIKIPEGSRPTTVHYNQTKIQAIDVIEDWKLDFNLGNVIKYVARADYKGNKAKDLKKAKWYLDRVVEGLED